MIDITSRDFAINHNPFLGLDGYHLYKHLTQTRNNPKDSL